MQKENILVSYDTSENVFVMDNIHGNTNDCFYHNLKLILWLFKKICFGNCTPISYVETNAFLCPRQD